MFCVSVKSDPLMRIQNTEVQLIELHGRKFGPTYAEVATCGYVGHFRLQKVVAAHNQSWPHVNMFGHAFDRGLILLQ